MRNNRHLYVAVGIATFVVVSFAVSVRWILLPTTYHFAANAQEICTDSDGGLNYSVKGGASRGGTPPYTDSCYCVIGGNPTNLGACTSGSFVGEWICNASGYTEMKTYECPNGCNNGACIAQAKSACGDDVVDASKGEECDDGSDNGKNGRCTAQCTRAQCTDTDGGNNEFQKGVTRSGFGEVTGAEDICADDGKSVYEAYCNGNIITSSVRITCANGCQNGACTQSSSNICTDTDGKDPYKKGFMTSTELGWKDAEEFCATPNHDVTSSYSYASSCSGNDCFVFEYSCSGTQPNTDAIHCPQGCSNGTCIAVNSNTSNEDNCRYDGVDGNNIGNVYAPTREACYHEYDAFGIHRPGSKVYFKNVWIFTYRDSPVPGTGSVPIAGYEDEVRVIDGAQLAKNWFRDMIVGTQETTAANFLAQNGIIGGFSDNTFRAGKLVNRAEAAKFLMLARFNGIEDRRNNDRFWDIPDGEWYVRFVMKAAELGVINGHPDGSFRPQDPVKVGEFLKMLVLTFDLPINLSYQDDSDGFIDVHPDDWFAPYAGIAMTYDLPSFATHSWPEDGPWVLRPERELTRGEVATAIFTILAPDDF